MSLMQLKAGANDNLVTLALKDLAGDAIENATVEVVIKTLGVGVELSGQTWPVNMPHTTDGVYSVVLESLGLTVGRVYRVQVTAYTPGGSELQYNSNALAVRKDAP